MIHCDIDPVSYHCNIIILTGSIQELIITSGGENIAPVPIENQILASLSEILSNAMVVGDNRKAFSRGSQVDAVLVEITCVACDVNHHLIDCVISFGSQRLFITLSTQLPIRVPHVVRTLRCR